jgi:hypothetical protein
MEDGVVDGQRHVAALRRIGWWVTVYGADVAWDKAERWNALNKDPLPQQDLTQIYLYVCNAGNNEVAAGECVRLPIDVLTWSKELSAGAVVYWCARAYYLQNRLSLPSDAAIAETMCVSPQSVRGWKREIRRAGLWGRWEEMPEPPFFPAPSTLLRGTEIRAKAGVRLTGLILAFCLSGNPSKIVYRKSIATHRGIAPSTVSRHIKDLSPILGVERIGWTEQADWLINCYTLYPALPLSLGYGGGIILTDPL